jgi:hypothetical protein
LQPSDAFFFGLLSRFSQPYPVVGIQTYAEPTAIGTAYVNAIPFNTSPAREFWPANEAMYAMLLIYDHACMPLLHRAPKPGRGHRSSYSPDLREMYITCTYSCCSHLVSQECHMTTNICIYTSPCQMHTCKAPGCASHRTSVCSAADCLQRALGLLNGCQPFLNALNANGAQLTEFTVFQILQLAIVNKTADVT